MSILAVVAACFLAIAIERRRGWLWLPTLLLLSLPLSYFLINNGWWDPDEMPTQYAAITAGTGYEGTDEYDPVGDDHMDLPSNAPLAAILPADPDTRKAPDGRITIDQWKTEQKQIRVRVTRDARIALRLLNYPAWRVTLNGNAVTSGSCRRYQPDDHSSPNRRLADSRAIHAHARPHPGPNVIFFEFDNRRDPAASRWMKVNYRPKTDSVGPISCRHKTN